MMDDNFRFVFKCSIDSMLILDQQGMIVSANVAFEKMSGFLSEALVNHPISKLIPEWANKKLTHLIDDVDACSDEKKLIAMA